MACDSPYMVKTGSGTDFVPVPCGKCAPCKQRRVSQWVFRMTQEEKVSTSSHFVTLTYDSRSLPLSKNGFPTLDKSDLQKFFKRLRKLCPDVTVKYYACGEYGTTNKRPHYHAIIFNVPDTQMYCDAWTLNGKLIGQIHVGQVTNASIAYTMKYIDKQTYKKKHGRDDRVPEFPLMSKKLGHNYLTDHSAKYHIDNLDKNYVTDIGGHKIAMPKYYRDRILTDDQKEQQRQIIANEVQKVQVQEYLDYETNPAVNGWSFQQWKDHQRDSRHEKFNRSQQIKKRDV